MDAFMASYLLLWAIVMVQGLVIVFLTRQLGAAILGTRDAIERDGIPVGKSVPSIEGVGAEGRTVRPLRTGQWSVLIYAAPTCGICLDMLPTLDRLIGRLAGKVAFTVLLEAPPEIRAEYASTTATRAEVIAIDRQTAKTMNVRVSPFVHVVDESGVVRAKGLVNEAAHVEHLLVMAGVTDSALPQHVEHRHEALGHAS
jgi:hypothetical protein